MSLITTYKQSHALIVSCRELFEGWYAFVMRLFEFEGKMLLADSGVATSTITSKGTLDELKYVGPSVLKAQVLFGNRAAKGLIHVVQTETEWNLALSKIDAGLRSLNLNPEEVTVVAENIVPFDQSLYLALRYDTHTRLPVLLFNAEGGSGVEDRLTASALQTFALTDLEKTVLPELHADIPSAWLQKLLEIFFVNDMTLLEINPLVPSASGPIALDAKIELDDTAAFRHLEWTEKYPPRTLFARQPTEREQQAKRVNAMDHRGVAGASYMDFDGTVAILASGGGASYLAMDALLSSHLKPANYTEYSGNPAREKVAALTDVVLSKPGLQALWVVGGNANFTDLYDTLMGVFDGVERAKLPPGFPIVVRRGGPRQEEAFTAIQERGRQLGLNVQVFGPEYPIPNTVDVLSKAIAGAGA